MGVSANRLTPGRAGRNRIATESNCDVLEGCSIIETGVIPATESILFRQVRSVECELNRFRRKLHLFGSTNRANNHGNFRGVINVESLHLTSIHFATE